jgi:hypothetical protein
LQVLRIPSAFRSGNFFATFSAVWSTEPPPLLRTSTMVSMAPGPLALGYVKLGRSSAIHRAKAARRASVMCRPSLVRRHNTSSGVTSGKESAA